MQVPLGVRSFAPRLSPDMMRIFASHNFYVFVLTFVKNRKLLFNLFSGTSSTAPADKLPSWNGPKATRINLFTCKSIESINLRISRFFPRVMQYLAKRCCQFVFRALSVWACILYLLSYSKSKFIETTYLRSSINSHFILPQPVSRWGL